VQECVVSTNKFLIHEFLIKKQQGCAINQRSLQPEVNKGLQARAPLSLEKKGLWERG
jgi:hypothetical protein